MKAQNSIFLCLALSLVGVISFTTENTPIYAPTTNIFDTETLEEENKNQIDSLIFSNISFGEDDAAMVESLKTVLNSTNNYSTQSKSQGVDNQDITLVQGSLSGVEDYHFVENGQQDAHKSVAQLNLTFIEASSAKGSSANSTTVGESSSASRLFVNYVNLTNNEVGNSQFETNIVDVFFNQNQTNYTNAAAQKQSNGWLNNTVHYENKGGVFVKAENLTVVNVGQEAFNIVKTNLTLSNHTLAFELTDEVINPSFLKKGQHNTGLKSVEVDVQVAKFTNFDFVELQNSAHPLVQSILSGSPSQDQKLKSPPQKKSFLSNKFARAN